MSAQDLGVGRFAAFYENGVISGNIVYYEVLSITMSKTSFFEYVISGKSFKRCPRDAKIALGISDDGEG